MPKVDFVIPGRSRECRFPLCVKIPPCSLVIGSPLRNQATSALGLAWTWQITSVSSLELVCINVCSCITSGASEMKNQNRYNIRRSSYRGASTKDVTSNLKFFGQPRPFLESLYIYDVPKTNFVVHCALKETWYMTEIRFWFILTEVKFGGRSKWQSLIL